MSLLQTVLPPVLQGFSQASGDKINPLLQNTVNQGIKSTANYDSILNSLKKPGDVNGIFGKIGVGIKKANLGIESFSNNLLSGADNLLGKGFDNMNSSTNLIAGAVGGITNSITDSIRGYSVNTSTTSDKIFDGVKMVSKFLPPVVGAAVEGLGVINNLTAKPYDGTSTNDMTNALMAGNYKTFSGISRLTNKGAIKHHKNYSNLVKYTNLLNDDRVKTDGNLQMAATNTTGSLFNKNALQKQGGLGTGSFLAKKGGVINPAQLRNIVYKAQKGAKLKKVEKDRSIEELVKYANEANPSFINRLQTNDTRAIKFKDDEGNESQGTHYLEWGTNDSGKAIVYPRIQLDGDSLKFFNSDEAYNRALNGNHLEMTPSEAELFTKEYKNHYPNFFNAFKFKEGGKMNVIPEGALHARKHDLPEEIAEQVTKKGIPVVTEEEGGKLTQHAEIERDEIIFHKEATNTIEDYFKKYNEAKTTKEKDKIALECGKYLTSEILTNTDDRTGLLEITK